MDPIVGETAVHRLDDLEDAPPPGGRLPHREAHPRRLLPDRGRRPAPWLFPQLAAHRDRLARRVRRRSRTTRSRRCCCSPEWEHDAAEKVYHAIVRGTRRRGAPAAHPAPLRPDRLHPVRRLHDHQAGVPGRQEPPQLPRRGLRTGRRKVGQVLDELDEVAGWVKNQGLGLRIPYTLEGEPPTTCPTSSSASTTADRSRSTSSSRSPASARRTRRPRSRPRATLWVPAVNNHGRFGRWAFLEITDPWDAGTPHPAHICATGQRSIATTTADVDKSE